MVCKISYEKCRKLKTATSIQKVPRGEGVKCSYRLKLFRVQKTHFFFISKKMQLALHRQRESLTQALKMSFYLKLCPKITLHIRTYTLDGRLQYSKSEAT